MYALTAFNAILALRTFNGVLQHMRFTKLWQYRSDLIFETKISMLDKLYHSNRSHELGARCSSENAIICHMLAISVEYSHITYSLFKSTLDVDGIAPRFDCLR